MGVPAVGGARAGVGERGVYGLFLNPAAARPSGPELLLDAALFTNRFRFTLEGEEEVQSGGTSPVPALAVAVPLGPVGLGASFGAPYARGGAPYDEDGPQRYFTIQGTTRVLELDLAVAGHLATAERDVDPPRLIVDVGAGPRLAFGTQGSTRAYDTGALLYGLLEGEGDVPLQDPFLEGRLTVPPARDLGLGWTAGARVELDQRWVLTGAYRSGVRLDLEGPVSLVPSNDLAMELEGTVETTLHLPPSASVGLGKAGHYGAQLSGTWTGWSSLEVVETRVQELAITSEDPLMGEILESYGLSDAEFLSSLDTIVTRTGMHDTITVDLAGSYTYDGRWSGGAHLARSGAAIPDTNVHPGNVDFDVWNPGLWLCFQPGPFALSLGGDVYLAAPREITTSGLALTNEAASGMVYPSGNGRYELLAARVGLTAVYRP